ncbi:MAG: hypothetical protein KDD51_07060, partial [Bdellovibrionales bacterium]|nr:hypothetical protein [Bdellovibrionales bacterium]
MGDNKKLNLQRYKKSAKGVMEFARLIETASPELRERMIEQAREEDPAFLDNVLAQVRKLEAFNAKQELKLERFKKSQTGIIEFARLLEQSTPQVRETILKRAKEQDSAFVQSVLRKTVFFEELIFLDEGVLAEILSDTPPKVLAHAVYGMEAKFCKKLMANVGHRTQRQVKDEEENFGT